AASRVYPGLAPNLYLDRPLVVYGHYPPGVKSIVLQAIGHAFEAKCDMVFNLDLENTARPGGREIREEWARHRAFHLMSLYARYPGAGIAEELERTVRTYNLNLPYRMGL
ncbi:MAG: hypothetical protein N2255_00370, partial [Kiritimatiellae bacterium]|nr:hypothetical protein [Kiritimatiellia bacterium]